MSSEHPILFSAPMVKALRAGLKTQTRRIVNPQPQFTGAAGDSFEWHAGKCLERVGYGAPYIHSNWTAVEAAMLKVCPYGKPGHLLWVRESFAIDACGLVHFIKEDWAKLKPELEWKPSIHLPRWASRIKLEITAIRVQRLQDITEMDAQAEGIGPTRSFECFDGWGPYSSTFFNLWDHLNGKKFSWSSNPFVWAITFKIL